MLLVLLVAGLALANTAAAEAQAAEQLLDFLNHHQEPAGIMKTSYGYPVTYKEANLGINRESSLLLNPYILESISHFSLERIPPRPVHANGAGAKGYFEASHDVSNVTNVNVFNTVGKKTPIFIRFSPTTGEIGNPELANREKGIAIKFYTEEGNLDITGLNANVFAIKDPVFAESFIHCFKPNPRTNLKDVSLTWDFIANHPESLFSFSQNMSPLGQPTSYLNMPGHALHTFQVENNKGKESFVRFHWLPDAGIKNFTDSEVQTLLGPNPDYHTQDLYNNIANGTYPTYTYYMQVVPKKDINKAKFDLFDITLNWPEKYYPFVPIGKLVLNKNVDNFFAEVEQAAFNPGNLVPGIRGMDKMFEARNFMYRDSAIHRLGTGFNNIPINCPLNRPLTYNRDGHAPVLDNGGDSPNYYPNSFHGYVPVNKTLSPLHRPLTERGPTNYWQVANFFNGLSASDQNTTVANIGKSLGTTPKLVQNKVLNILKLVDATLASRVTARIANASSSR